VARGGIDAARRRDLERAVREKYRRAALDPRGLFPYPIGREGARALGYSRERIDAAPRAVLERFVGVGDPFEVRAPATGERVLDVGCGAGLDTLAAGARVGRSGLAVGIDPASQLVAFGRDGARHGALPQVAFVAGSAEELPFAHASFDQVSSNGALNLVVDKRRAFGELARVLRPGGTLAIADLLVVEGVPDELLADMDAWST
jgi:SAM-dependent methyltransferase